MSRSRLMKTSVLSVAAALLIAAIFAASSFVAHTIAAPQAVIVELKSDPVVVAKALAEGRGQNFDALAYRQQLIAEQNQLLNQLSAAGVSFNLVSVDAPNGTNGEVTNIQFRYNYVFNGLTLAVPAEAMKTIEGMSQVKSVHKDEQITMQLDHAVNYLRAPSLSAIRRKSTRLIRSTAVVLRDKESTSPSSTLGLTGRIRCLAAIRHRRALVLDRRLRRSTQIRKLSTT